MIQGEGVSQTKRAKLTQDPPKEPDKQFLVEGAPSAEAFQWTGRNVSEMLIVEIFAGTARLSRACRDLGFRIFPVDKSNSRTKQMHLVTYDLTLKEDVQALKEVLAKEKANILWAHFLPACGTCSRARERPLPKLKKKGYKVARPLRSLNTQWVCRD